MNMTKTNEFTPAQIKTIRGIVRDEIARHDQKLKHEEERYQQAVAEANAEAAMTSRDWGDLD
ncbi:hypothetical protein ACFQ5J_09045 [Lacticaseibacillus baoqingensis]|uniref:Uncharacterized protein n=2 Tax=Lacticaseibacillus baoqingensis TaxID=2486013 RepID=A0ABW4E941_9LACO